MKVKIYTIESECVYHNPTIEQLAKILSDIDLSKYLQVRVQTISENFLGIYCDPQPFESWEDGYHEFDTQKLEPVQDIPSKFKINDCVNPIKSIIPTYGQAYIVQSSTTPNPHDHFLTPSNIGIINKVHHDVFPGTDDLMEHYQVDFGGYGIWYVCPELLKLQDEDQS